MIHRIIKLLVCLAIIGMCLYPPWQRMESVAEGMPIYIPDGYHFLWYKSLGDVRWIMSDTARIDFARLGVQCFIAMVAGYGLLQLLPKKKDKKSTEPESAS